MAGIERYKGAAPIDPLRGKIDRPFYFYLSEDHQMYTFYMARSCGEAIEKFIRDKQFDLWQVDSITEDRK